MESNEAQKLIDELKGRFDRPFSTPDKELITKLYFDVLGKVLKPTKCQRCYHDAFIEIACYLRKNTMEKKRQYTMRAGFIIASPVFHNGKIYTNANLTDKIAEEYIAMFPSQARFFNIDKAQENAPNASKSSKVVNTTAGQKKPAKRKKKA